MSYIFLSAPCLEAFDVDKGLWPTMRQQPTQVSTFIAGAGQQSYRDVAKVDHPAMLMTAAARSALIDTGIRDIAKDVDALACVEPVSWSYDNLAATVAENLGCNQTVEHLWVPAGGTSPQDLLHTIGQRIAAGELNCAVICGAESMRTRKRAKIGGERLPWPERPVKADPWRDQPHFSSALERRHGLALPIQLFPMLENALRFANKHSMQEQVRIASQLLANNARVAADNPNAWFRDAPSAAMIGKPSPDNRMIVYPYTKRMNAIMDVDQAAAIVVVSRHFMETRGLSSRSAAVVGGAGAESAGYITEREALAQSPAMETAIDTALSRAGIHPDQLDAMDLYSCFPSAVQLALQALGTGVADQRQLTLTGGLAFAGGPGNAYVLHALARALVWLRERDSDRLLVTGIGMANSKHTASVLTSALHIPEEASGELSYRETIAEKLLSVNSRPQGDARVITYTVEYDRQENPINTLLIVELENGERSIANMHSTNMGAHQLLDQDSIGRFGKVAYDTQLGRNLFEFK